MKAAIYARKSTDDASKGEQNQSVTRQVEQARKYIESKGWILPPDYIYVDDNISGTLFPRPALTRLIDNLSNIDVVVMMDSDRLGRDQEQTPIYRAKINRKARIFYYLRDQEFVANTPTDKLMAQIEDWRASMEVEMASQRARDALMRKADKGYNVGGIVFGYDNYWLYPDGQETKATPGKTKPENCVTIFKINTEQAKTILGIFTMYSDGYGLTIIAKTLNGDRKHTDKLKHYFNGIPQPSPRKGTQSWAPSSIRGILHNDRYIGLIHYGKMKKIRADGKKYREKQTDYKTLENPDLAIVPIELWKAVQHRIKTVNNTFMQGNTFTQQPDTGKTSRYLLTGIARCGCCGGSVVNVGGKIGKNNSELLYYKCSYRHKRGSTVCDNDQTVRVNHMEDAVLASIEAGVLNPDIITATVNRAMQLIREKQKQDTERPARLTKEIQKVERELANFMKIIATGKAPESILAEINQREERLASLRIELEEATTPVNDDLDDRRLRKALITRIGQFKELMYSDTVKAKNMLKQLLDGPLLVLPVEDGKGWRFEGKTRIGPLLDPGYTRLASPRGFEPLLPP